jgi:2-amino-4-hydroxy-6-hydroxymethyldihydropteridine diphosphokinase
MSNVVFLGLGSNIGEREFNIEKAVEKLREVMMIEKLSSLYETEPKKVQNHPVYLNQVLQGTTHLSPHELLSKLKEIEKLLGRETKGDLSPRLIDIDIIFYNQNRIRSEELTIPHKQAHTRNFVLVPLVEIAPDLIHPDFDIPIKEVLEKCSDECRVTLVES